MTVKSESSNLIYKVGAHFNTVVVGVCYATNKAEIRDFAINNNFTSNSINGLYRCRWKCDHVNERESFHL